MSKPPEPPVSYTLPAGHYLSDIYMAPTDHSDSAKSYGDCLFLKIRKK